MSINIYLPEASKSLLSALLDRYYDAQELEEQAYDVLVAAEAAADLAFEATAAMIEATAAALEVDLDVYAFDPSIPAFVKMIEA